MASALEEEVRIIVRSIASALEEVWVELSVRSIES